MSSIRSSSSIRIFESAPRDYRYSIYYIKIKIKSRHTQKIMENLHKDWKSLHNRQRTLFLSFYTFHAGIDKLYNFGDQFLRDTLTNTYPRFSAGIFARLVQMTCAKRASSVLISFSIHFMHTELNRANKDVLNLSLFVPRMLHLIWRICTTQYSYAMNRGRKNPCLNIKLLANNGEWRKKKK